MVYLKNYHKGIEVPFVISRVLMKRYTDVNQIMIYHILNHIRSIETVDIGLSVVMIISIVNQFRYIVEKMLFTC